MKRVLSITIASLIGLMIAGCHAEADVHDHDRDMDHTTVHEKKTTTYEPTERTTREEKTTETVR